MLKEEFIKEEYEIYTDSIKYISNAITKEYGTKAIPGYVLLNKDKQPKQCMNSSMFPLTDEREIAKYNAMRVLPNDIIVMGNNKLYKKLMGDFWGKHTQSSILKMFEKKELGDLNALGTGKYFVVVDIDTKNINFKTPSLAKIESLLPKTLVVNTPSGGKHYYFLVEKGSNVPFSTTLPCIDILGKGKLVVAPGQEREGKGSYSLDTSNPNFSYEMSSWNEDIRSSLSSLFTTQTLPTGYLDTSSFSQEKAPVSKKPCVPESSPKFIKESVKLALKGGSKIEEGMRNRAVFDYCSLIADRTPATELLSKALEFNKSFLVKPLPVREVEGIVKSCVRSFGCYTGKSKEQSKADTSKFQNLYVELNSILSKLDKSEEYTTKIEDIVPVIQKFFESKFGKAYSKSIPSAEVGKILRAAGFDKKKIQKDGIRAWLWNFSAKSIESLEAVIHAFVAAKVSSEKFKNPTELVLDVNSSSSVELIPVDCSTPQRLQGLSGINPEQVQELFEKFGNVLRTKKDITLDQNFFFSDLSQNHSLFQIPL